MALSASSSCTTAVTTCMASVSEGKGKVTEGKGLQAEVLLPLPVKPKFQSSTLRRTKSRKPVKATKVSASVREAGDVDGDQSSAASVILEAVSKVGDEVATTSGEVLDAVVGDAPAAMRVRRSAGKTNSSRTSRRRALVMCLALGMVRPCASTDASSVQNSSSASDLRRTVSAAPAALRRTDSSSFKAPGATLASQVSLATTLKQTNLLGEKSDLQKLTTLQ